MTLQAIEEVRSSLVLTEQVVVGVPLIFEGQSSIADMVEILQPLEVRHCHTASIQVHVLQEETKSLACLVLTSLWVELLQHLPCTDFKYRYGKEMITL